MSLEQLMNVEVTSVSKHAEKLSEAPAAIYVITQEDLRRSGATTIADALRMVPGMDVAQINGSEWAISSRGFNSRFADKLQVLIDGESVYTPLFSGVYWDTLDTMMEDIDRIEVIRGPGASLWGANAVNGVINIITKSAKDTQGGLAVGGGGSHERGFGGIRYGGKISDTAYYRVYAKYTDRSELTSVTGTNALDGVNLLRGGFRADWDANDLNSLTFQGDAYEGQSASGAIANLFDVNGGNLLGRWKHTFSATSEMTLQTYYVREEREFDVLNTRRNTADVDFQHSFALGDRQRITWGGGYRFTSDKNIGTLTLSFAPPRSSDHLRQVFLQDDITLVEDRLHFITGSKLEYNDYTGLEVQPNGRLLWTPNSKNTVWASVARAVRSPSRADSGVQALSPVAPGVFAGFFGNPDFDSEKLVAYELGYRVQPHEKVALDVTTFYNDYSNLRSVTPGTPFVSGANLIVPFTANNNMAGETYGGEISANWQVLPEWRLNAGYSLLQMHLRHGLGTGDSTLEAAAADNPQQQFHILSYIDLPWHLQFDTAAYYVDSLPGQGVANYVRLDLRLGWRPTPNFEASVVVQNLLDHRHPEYGNDLLVTPAQVERGIYGKLTWRF